MNVECKASNAYQHAVDVKGGQDGYVDWHDDDEGGHDDDIGRQNNRPRWTWGRSIWLEGDVSSQSGRWSKLTVMMTNADMKKLPSDWKQGP